MFGVSRRPGHQQEAELASLVHEGPFDLSAFSYAQAPLVPQQQVPAESTLVRRSSYSSVPVMDVTNISLFNPNWNMTDWHGVGVDINPFLHHQTTSSPPRSSDYFTGAQVPVASNNAEARWKLLHELSPSNNISDAFLLLDDAKLQLLDLNDSVNNQKLLPVQEIKQEEVDDPWTEHVDYASNHNHTYATTLDSRRRGQSLEVSN
jgi:hypothetical protein